MDDAVGGGVVVVPPLLNDDGLLLGCDWFGRSGVLSRGGGGALERGVTLNYRKNRPSVGQN